jgi:hypothetical protein
MAASDYVPIFFKNRLHLAGRPQMSTRPKYAGLKGFYRRPVLPTHESKQRKPRQTVPGPPCRLGLRHNPERRDYKFQ